MKTSELIEWLNESLAENGDIPVNVIFCGEIDEYPSVNVEDGILYIEGSNVKY